MDWLFSLAGVVVGLLVVGPPVLVGAMFLILLGMGLFGPAAPIVAHRSFECPFSKRRAQVEFLGKQGDTHAGDVLACSVFHDPRQVRCDKKCLGLAEVAALSAPLMPRFALLSGGVGYRVEAKQAQGALQA
jgi:hypothetical protein